MRHHPLRILIATLVAFAAIAATSPASGAQDLEVDEFNISGWNVWLGDFRSDDRQGTAEIIWQPDGTYKGHASIYVSSILKRTVRFTVTDFDQNGRVISADSSVTHTVPRGSMFWGPHVIAAGHSSGAEPVSNTRWCLYADGELVDCEIMTRDTPIYHATGIQVTGNPSFPWPWN